MRCPSILRRAAARTGREFHTLLDSAHYGHLYRPPRAGRPAPPRRLLLRGIETSAPAAAAFRSAFPEGAEAALSSADLICDHVFDLLGSGLRRLSDPAPDRDYAPIKWHLDVTSGYTWNPRLTARRIPLRPAPGVEVRVPWELSRFQHLPILGKAFLLTGQERYLREYTSQIEDWIEHNPVGLGVNWASPMDAALRAVSWLAAGEFLPLDRVGDSFLTRLQTSLAEHGAYLRSHLERYGNLSNNHYIADLVGLLLIGLCCPHLPRADSWRRFSQAELEAEARRQVYADGCHFEGSTAYHGLVLEMLFYAELLAARAGTPFSAAYRSIIRNMCAAALTCTKPDGRLPQIGDNDSAQFIALGPRRSPGLAHLFPLAALHLADASLDPGCSPELRETLFWVFGPAAAAAARSLPPAAPHPAASSLPDAGWHVMRTAADYAFVSCGRLGQSGHGGHNHNDLLSFELVLGGRDLIVDPGTYCYFADPAARNRFRSTQSHNTIQVDALEQNRIDPTRLFRLLPTGRIGHASVRETDGRLSFHGAIEYEGVQHSRRIMGEHVASRWRVEDRISSARPGRAVIRFHLAPGLQSDGQSIRASDGRTVARLQATGYSLCPETYGYSPGYGSRCAAVRLVGHFPVGPQPATVALAVIAES